MRVVSLPGVSFGGVSRADGASAPARSNYQMALDVNDGVMVPKLRGGQPVRHVQQWLMLPYQVDRKLWTRERVWAEASSIEKRADAREARFLDIDWSRELPDYAIEGFVETLFRRFPEKGLPVQVDREISIAADGGANDHLHGEIGTRLLSNEGFSPRKYRKLDNWFRRDVRRLVADLFNEIAEREGIDVRFDPRSNAEQGAALPPEDRLPRTFIRHPNSRGAKVAIAHRDEQRRLKLEHSRVVAEIDALETRIRELETEVKEQVLNLSQLVSLQHDGRPARPLDLELTITAFMRAGVEARDRISIEDVGMVYVVEGSLIVDVGNEILFDRLRTRGAVSALRIVARAKGWRDLSAYDPNGMPIPVPKEPGSAPGPSISASPGRSHFDLLGHGSIVSAANEILNELREASPEDRQALSDRVAHHGSSDLTCLVTKLDAWSGSTPETHVGFNDITGLLDEVLEGDGGLWRRYVLERDLETMCLHGSTLSRPFNPPPRFYDIYNVPRPGASRLDERAARHSEVN